MMQGQDSTEFAPAGAKWWYSSYCKEFSDCSYLYLEATKDTVIKGKVASKVEFFKEDSLIPGSAQFFYSDSNKVYHYIDSSFYVLYDFTSQKGDTLHLKLGNFISYFYPFGGGDTIIEYSVVVDSTGVMNVNGQNLRFYYTMSPSNNWLMPMVIERIGGTPTLFGMATITIPEDYGPEFRCYSDDSLFYKSFDKECTFIATGIPYPKIGDKKVQVYPTIFQNNFFIEHMLNEPLKISLYNLVGIKVMEQTVPAGTATIDAPPHLAAGVYFLNVKYQEQQYNLKLIKQ